MSNESKVKLIGLSDTGEKLCAAGGRISTQPGDAIDIWERSQDAEKNAVLIERVTKSGHTSVIEHTTFHLLFQNVSAVVEQFVIEYRLASYTVKSRRYVDFANAGYHSPTFKNSKHELEFNKLIDGLFVDYQKLIDGGIPKEDARFILPYAFHSNFICSVNARELLHMLDGMLFGRGASFPEIYAIGESILKQIEKETPGIAKTFHNQKKRMVDTVSFDFIKNIHEFSEKESQEENVRLIYHTDDPVKAVAFTALKEANSFSNKQMSNAITDDLIVKKVIETVLKSSRPRALESAQFTFELNNMSLSTLTHIVRHRMQSVLVPPLTKTNRNHYIVPETVKASAELLELYKNAFAKAQTVYEKLLSDGVSETALVYTLLSGNTLDIVLSMNARELLLFFKLRTCERAQWEVVDYATEMLLQLRAKFPALFTGFGPNCYVLGYCPEGKLTCGNIKEVRKRFQMGNKITS